MTMLADPVQEIQGKPDIPKVRWLRHRLAAGVASGLVLWMAFPPMDWGLLAWIALAPLFWLVTVREAPGKTYLAATAGGLVFWILAVPWLSLIGPGAWIGWVVLGSAFSLWWPMFLVMARWARFRLGLPLILAAPIAWITTEYLRAYFLTGFPWYYLAHSQYRFLYVTQISDITGSLGVSLLIAMVNAWLVELITLPMFRTRAGGPPRLTRDQTLRLWTITLLVGSTLCYGAYRVSTARFRPGPRVALLQSNLRQGHKFERNPFTIQSGFMDLIHRAMANDPRPDLVVWPETSYPFAPVITIAPGLDPKILEAQVTGIDEKLNTKAWLEKQVAVDQDLRGMTANVRVPMLIGSGIWKHEPDRMHKYNSALLFRPGQMEPEVYHKMHLVPFGETIPMMDVLPFLSALTPYRDKIPNLDSGQDPRIFEVGPYKVAAVICFEDTIPHVINEFFHGVGQSQQPDLLINLSNDGWYPDSSELDTHLAIGVFRAIEHRVPLARAVNTGFTALVDGNGEIRARLPKSVEDILTVQVPLDDRTTLYSRWGDWLGKSCLAICIGWIPLGFVRPAGRTRPQT